MHVHVQGLQAENNVSLLKVLYSTINIIIPHFRANGSTRNTANLKYIPNDIIQKHIIALTYRPTNLDIGPI